MSNDTRILIESMLTNDSNIVNLLIKKSENNEITDKIRKDFLALPLEEQQKIYNRLESILKMCYSDIFKEIDSLSKEELFSLKESLIYYLGRFSIPNIDLLKKIYTVEKNKNLLFNIVCSSLITFDEEIELDFISRIEPGNDYDLLIRSWTLAFYTNIKNPYEYIDNGTDDWSNAKNARLKRLAINDENNPKFNKAKAFRLIDLVVINLFLENRGFNAITKEDYKIIDETKINFKEYSEDKIKKLTYFKEKIISNTPY